MHALPSTSTTTPGHYLNRRQFIKLAAVGSTAAAEMALGVQWPTLRPDCDVVLKPGLERESILALYDTVKRNTKFNLNTPLTDAMVAGTHNNFYEFTTNKSNVWRMAQDFQVDPWSIEITGACAKPGKFDIDDIYRIGRKAVEERTYRFRCVEAWAMDVPWTGFELRQLLQHVEPLDRARYVRFITASRPGEMPGVAMAKHYPWPYFEALRMDEAMNELTLMATGIYGRPLPRQHGAPFRVIVPWKYGYKSPKSIVRIELVEKKPPTFWNQVAPHEYGFLSNIRPNVPHPRWSQAQERMIGTGERRPTLPFGGYGTFVGHLYQS